MPRTARTALRRTLSTTTTVLVLLVLTALPALAASGTKPDPDADPYLVGSLQELVTAAVVGIVVALIAWTLLPKAAATQDDHH